jgi:hypothetical protein
LNKERDNTFSKQKHKMMSKNKIGLLLAAAAAYGVYRYSKMTPEQKTNLKTKGKEFIDKNLGDLTNLVGKKKAATNGNGY